MPVKASNRAAITDETDFGQFLRDLDAYTGAGVIKDAIKFQILTMARPGEVRGAQKSEVSLEKRTWTIPAERTKMRREHMVPLSDQALELVETNWPHIDGVELLFPSLNSNRKWLSEDAFNSAICRIGWRASRSPQTQFVLDALEQALYEGRPAGGLIHHSNRGSQYVSIRYTERLAPFRDIVSRCTAGQWKLIVLANALLRDGRKWSAVRA